MAGVGLGLVRGRRGLALLGLVVLVLVLVLAEREDIVLRVQLFRFIFQLVKERHDWAMEVMRSHTHTPGWDEGQIKLRRLRRLGQLGSKRVGSKQVGIVTSDSDVHTCRLIDKDPLGT